MKTPAVLFTLAAAALTACAANPARHLQPNGVAPSVAVDIQERNVWVTDTVGVAEHRDQNGVLTGTTAVTHDRIAGRETYIAGFKLVRGTEELDAVDFYHLAGNNKAARDLDAYRARGVLYNRIGLGILAAGLAGVVMMQSGNGTVAKTGTTLFTVGVPVGGIMAIMGKSRANANTYPLQHALDSVGQPMPTVGPVSSRE